MSTFTDIATRTYNHGWRLDPVVRSLLDTDFYKLLMLQMIREFYPDQQVTFSVINRSRQVRPILDEGSCAARPCPLDPLFQEGTDRLAGNTFWQTQMFARFHPGSPARPPEYELTKVESV